MQKQLPTFGSHHDAVVCVVGAASFLHSYLVEGKRVRSSLIGGMMGQALRAKRVGERMFVEQLERRLLRTVIYGTSGNDTITLDSVYDNSSSSHMDVWVGANYDDYELTETSTFTIETGGGDDTIIINSWSRAEIEGDFDGGDDVTVIHGNVLIDSARHLGALQLTNFGARVTMTSTSECLYLQSLSIAGGVLDLGNNDIVVDYTSSSPFSTILNYATTGYSATPTFFAQDYRITASDNGGGYSTREVTYYEDSNQWEWTDFDHESPESKLVRIYDNGGHWVLVWNDDLIETEMFFRAPLTGNDYPPMDMSQWTYWKTEWVDPEAGGTPQPTGVLIDLTADPGWGIISTAGRNSASPSGEVLALFDNAAAQAGFTEWPDGSNVSVDSTSIIGKFTYNGDANLDGEISGDDYFILDSHPYDTNIAVGSRWLFGDLDRDGAVDQDDYDILDAYY